MIDRLSALSGHKVMDGMASDLALSILKPFYPQYLVDICFNSHDESPVHSTMDIAPFMSNSPEKNQHSLGTLSTISIFSIS